MQSMLEMLQQGMVGLMYWIRDSTKQFRDDMRRHSSAFLEYSDGLPILGNVAVSKQPVINDLKVWYSSSFVDFRYSTNLAWKLMYDKIQAILAELVEQQISAMDRFYVFIQWFSLLLVAVSVLLLALLASVRMKRDYSVCIATFSVISARTLASNPYLLFHLKQFFHYAHA